MLIVADSAYVNDSPTLKVFNFSSFIEGSEKLDLLPMNIFSCNTEHEFDMAYAQFIMSNDDKFFDMMKLVMTLYAGIDVFLLVSNLDRNFEQINESFLKFIQQRYGYPYRIVNNKDDLDAIAYYTNDSFSVMGLYNLDIDKERFALLSIERMKAHGINFIPEGCLYFDRI